MLAETEFRFQLFNLQIGVFQIAPQLLDVLLVLVNGLLHVQQVSLDLFFLRLKFLGFRNRFVSFFLLNSDRGLQLLDLSLEPRLLALLLLEQLLNGPLLLSYRLNLTVQISDFLPELVDQLIRIAGKPL